MTITHNWVERLQRFSGVAMAKPVTTVAVMRRTLVEVGGKSSVIPIRPDRPGIATGHGWLERRLIFMRH